MRSLIQKPFNVGKRAFFCIEKWLYYQKWLETNSLTFPDFLCIGSQKAGSTWVYENLRCHPKLFLPERKELNYFSNKYRFYGLPLKAYSNYFNRANGVKGEVTPCANLPLKRIRFIKTVIPSVKLILVIRNPVERMWASALMYLVRAQKRAFESIKDEEFYKLFNDQDLFSRGDYPAILKNWRSVFADEQLHICFYDDLKAHPKAFLTEIFKFLEVSPEIDWESLPYQTLFNKSAEHEMPAHISSYLQNLYEESLETLRLEFPEVVEKWTPLYEHSSENNSV